MGACAHQNEAPAFGRRVSFSFCVEHGRHGRPFVVRLSSGARNARHEFDTFFMGLGQELSRLEVVRVGNTHAREDLHRREAAQQLVSAGEELTGVGGVNALVLTRAVIAQGQEDLLERCAGDAVPGLETGKPLPRPLPSLRIAISLPACWRWRTASSPTPSIWAISLLDSSSPGSPTSSRTSLVSDILQSFHLIRVASQRANAAQPSASYRPRTLGTV